jgi:hypothetical protein
MTDLPLFEGKNKKIGVVKLRVEKIIKPEFKTNSQNREGFDRFEKKCNQE